jgi:hypothetical protein
MIHYPARFEPDAEKGGFAILSPFSMLKQYVFALKTSPLITKASSLLLA